jgi:hypothetical protein
MPTRFRVPPRETAPPPVRPPEVLMVMAEFWSWALPMVVEEITWPFAFTARRDDVRPVKAKLVVVAEVVVLLRPVKFWRVVEPVWRVLVKVAREA